MSLTIRQRLAGIPGRRICPICPEHRPYVDNNQFSQHMLDDHQKAPPSVELGFLCPWPQCVARLKNELAMKDHLKIHTGERDHTCPHLITWEGGNRVLCGKTYPSSKSLQRHRQTVHKYNSVKHTADDPYVDSHSNQTLESAPLLGLGESEDFHTLIEVEEGSQNNGNSSGDSDPPSSRPDSRSEEDRVMDDWKDLIGHTHPHGTWPRQETHYDHNPGHTYNQPQTHTPHEQGPPQHTASLVNAGNNHDLPAFGAAPSPPVFPATYPQPDYLTTRAFQNWVASTNRETANSHLNTYNPLELSHGGHIRAPNYEYQPNLGLTPYSQSSSQYGTDVTGSGNMNMYGLPGFDFGYGNFWEYPNATGSLGNGTWGFTPDNLYGLYNDPYGANYGLSGYESNDTNQNA